MAIESSSAAISSLPRLAASHRCSLKTSLALPLQGDHETNNLDIDNNTFIFTTMVVNTAFNASLSGELRLEMPSRPSEIILSPRQSICSASESLFGFLKLSGEGKPPPLLLADSRFVELSPPSLLLSFLLLSLSLCRRSLCPFSILIPSSLRVSLKLFLL